MIKLNNKYLRIFIINHKNTINIEYLVSKAFFNTMDWWCICPTGYYRCRTTEEKKGLLPKARALRPVLNK
jgi:hypothetical protein